MNAFLRACVYEHVDGLELVHHHVMGFQRWRASSFVLHIFNEIQLDELTDMSRGDTKAGRYAAAAQAARETIDKQLNHLPCLCAANNLLYCFLVEARRIKEQQSTVYSTNNRNFQENFTANLKRAADSVKDQALRIYDGTTAQKVPYLGPMIAKMIREELWSLYPPEPPSEEELEERRRFEDREKEQAKRKRQAAKERESAAAAGAGPSTSATMNVISPDPTTTNNNNTNSPAKPRKKRERKATEYIPAFGSANYALMLTMYEAQAGPENKEYLSKQDLLDRAEASGLSNFPLTGNNPAVAVRQGDSRNFYNGWSGFKSQLVKHDLMRAWSNPKKIQLTRKGLDLAGRLYMDAVARGTLRPFTILLDNINGGGIIAHQQEDQQQSPVVAGTKRQSKGKRSATATTLSEDEVRRDSLDVPLADRLRKREEDELAIAIAASLGGGEDVEEKNGKEKKKTHEGKRRAVSLFNKNSNYDNDNNDLGNAPKQIIRSRKTQIITEEEVVDLLDDDDHDDRTADDKKPTAAAQTLITATATAAAITTTDASVLLELGYSKRRSLKVLGMTKDIDQALEIIDALSSSSEDEEDDGEEAATLQEHQPQVHTDDDDDDVPQEEGEEGRRPIRNKKKPKRSVDFVPLFSPTLEEIEEEKEHDRPPVELGRKKTEIDYDPTPPSPIPSLPSPSSQQQQQRTFMSPPSKQPASQHPFFAPSPSQTSSHLLNMGHIRGHQPMTQVGQQQYSQQRGFANINNSYAAIKLPPLPPGTCFKDIYDVVMLVDGREQYAKTATTTTTTTNNNNNNNVASTSSATTAAGASRIAALQTHIQTMTNKGINVEHRMLPIGDALWVARPKKKSNNIVTATGTGPTHHQHQEWVLDYVLERKSLADLVGSITGGRYESQCYVLRRCGLGNRFYLVEGEVDRMAKPTDQKMIRTKCAEIDVEGDFKLLCTINHQDTFRLYDRLTTAIYSHYANKMMMVDNNNNVDDIDRRLMTYSEWKDHVEIVTKGATTVHDLWGLMLMQVPGLGPETISTIIYHYPTPMSLYKVYREVKMKEGGGTGREWVSRGERMLVGLKPGEGGGREVGPEKSKKVFNMLFRKGWE